MAIIFYSICIFVIILILEDNARHERRMSDRRWELDFSDGRGVLPAPLKVHRKVRYMFYFGLVMVSIFIGAELMALIHKIPD